MGAHGRLSGVPRIVLEFSNTRRSLADHSPNTRRGPIFCIFILSVCAREHESDPGRPGRCPWVAQGTPLGRVATVESSARVGPGPIVPALCDFLKIKKSKIFRPSFSLPDMTSDSGSEILDFQKNLIFCRSIDSKTISPHLAHRSNGRS